MFRKRFSGSRKKLSFQLLACWPLVIVATSFVYSEFSVSIATLILFFLSFEVESLLAATFLLFLQSAKKGDRVRESKMEINAFKKGFFNSRQFTRTQVHYIRITTANKCSSNSVCNVQLWESEIKKLLTVQWLISYLNFRKSELIYAIFLFLVCLSLLFLYFSTFGCSTYH